MEFFTIFLSSLITLVSPAGIVVDRVAQKNIRSQFVAVEQLQVRVDNVPSYQLVQGKADRVRIAGRGLFPLKEIRLDTLELETDPIQVDLGKGNKGKLRLKQPLRTGVRLVLTEADLNRALRSPIVTNWLRKVGTGVVLEQDQARRVQRYEFLNPHIEFLDTQRLRFQIRLRDPQNGSTLDIDIESGIEVLAGRQFRLVKPMVRLNGDPLSDRVLEAVTDGFADRSDLANLEASGITSRLLQFQIGAQQLQIAAFIQVAPQTKP